MAWASEEPRLDFSMPPVRWGVSVTRQPSTSGRAMTTRPKVLRVQQCTILIVCRNWAISLVLALEVPRV